MSAPVFGYRYQLGKLRENALSEAIAELADSMGPIWGDKQRGSVEVRDELLRLARSIDFENYYETETADE